MDSAAFGILMFFALVLGVFTVASCSGESDESIIQRTVKRQVGQEAQALNIESKFLRGECRGPRYTFYLKSKRFNGPANACCARWADECYIGF